MCGSLSACSGVSGRRKDSGSFGLLESVKSSAVMQGLQRRSYSYCAPRSSPTRAPTGLVTVFRAMVNSGVPRLYMRYAATTPEITLPQTINLRTVPSFDIEPPVRVEMRALAIARGAELRPFRCRDAPGHPRRVVRKAQRAVRPEKNNSAMAAEAIEQVVDGIGSGLLRRAACCHAVDGPFAQHELHDRFTPPRERDRGRGVVGVTAAADQRAVTNTAGSLRKRAAGGGSRGKVAARIQCNRADRVMRVQRGVVHADLVGQPLLDFCVECGLAQRWIARAGT